MEIVKTIIHPHKNYTLEDEKVIPDVCTWLKGIDNMYMVSLCLSCAFTVVVVLLALLHLFHVLKYVSNERIQTDLYYLVFMYPVTSLCSLAGMFIPRAAPFLYAVALVYFMFCLFVMVSLLFNIFGSRKELSHYLLENNIRISFRVPPVCCLHWLPDIEATDVNLRRIEWLVFQTPILRTTLELTSVVVFTDLGHRHNLWFMFSQLFGLISMCVAFYGCYVIVPLGRARHAPYRFDFLFRIVDIAQCIYTIQKFCFDFASSFDIIQSDKLLSSGAKAHCIIAITMAIPRSLSLCRSMGAGAGAPEPYKLPYSNDIIQEMFHYCSRPPAPVHLFYAYGISPLRWLYSHYQIAKGGQEKIVLLTAYSSTPQCEIDCDIVFTN